MPKNTYTDEEYKNDFLSDEKINKNALKQALDIRKFEIELYWKRATYFWAFIAATFAGFITLQVADTTKVTDKTDMSVLLSCLGIVFSFAWLCVNRGSKYWQENWEYHVDMLEDGINGPLYKVVMSRSKPIGIWQYFVHFLTGPSPLSVSKINQLISLFVTIIWIFLLIYSLPDFRIDNKSDWIYTSMLALTILICFAFLIFGRTYPGGYWHRSTKRTAMIKHERHKWKLPKFSLSLRFVQAIFWRRRLLDFAAEHDFKTELLSNEQLKKGIEQGNIEAEVYIDNYKKTTEKKLSKLLNKFYTVFFIVVLIVLIPYLFLIYLEFVHDVFAIHNILRLVAAILLIQAALGKQDGEIETYKKRTVLEQINQSWPIFFYVVASLLLLISFFVFQ